jgi:plastocyanin
VQGVTIREAPLMLDHGGSDTALVDATPETPGYEDSAFLPGQTLDDRTGGLHVTVGQVTPQGAQVTVRFDHVLDFEPPTDPSNIKVSAGKGGPAVIDWSPSTDNHGVTGYHVWRYTHDGTRHDMIGTTTKTTFTDPGATKGWFIYGVQALDAVGNASRKAESGWLHVHAAG